MRRPDLPPSAILLGLSRRLALLTALPLVIAAFCAGAAQPAATAEEPRQLRFENKPWSGDFDGMVKRRMIRVLVPYSRTLYYNDKGHERGVTAELVRNLSRGNSLAGSAAGSGKSR